MTIPLKEYSSPKVLIKKAMRRASTGTTSSCETTEASSPEDISPPESPKQRRHGKAKRSSSISFDTLDQVQEIPRYDDDEKKKLFYQDFEVFSMRCDAKMEKVGMDPDNIDWKSLR
jgi:hypothetical protein